MVTYLSNSKYELVDCFTLRSRLSSFQLKRVSNSGTLKSYEPEKVILEGKISTQDITKIFSNASKDGWRTLNFWNRNSRTLNERLVCPSRLKQQILTKLVYLSQLLLEQFHQQPVFLEGSTILLRCQVLLTWQSVNL